MHGANLGINFWLWGIDISSTLLNFGVTFQLIIHSVLMSYHKKKKRILVNNFVQFAIVMQDLVI
jgi:hypothetical protein